MCIEEKSGSIFKNRYITIRIFTKLYRKIYRCHNEVFFFSILIAIKKSVTLSEIYLIHISKI